MQKDNPVIELVKLPVPLPSVVKPILFSNVGFGDVFQQTPLAVTVAPPSEVTFPPLVAELEVILLIEEVVTVGRSAKVVKFTWFPYEVPRLFVA